LKLRRFILRTESAKDAPDYRSSRNNLKTARFRSNSILERWGNSVKIAQEVVSKNADQAKAGQLTF